jgi:hypothetical protein
MTASARKTGIMTENPTAKAMIFLENSKIIIKKMARINKRRRA